MDISRFFEDMFGEMKFYAGLDEKLFAEISISDSNIDIKIIHPVVTIQAMLIHIFKKSRVGSNKLKALRDAGYTITIRYGKLKFKV